MPNIAILVGNTEYRSLAQLDCCAADLVAMNELLVATEKYETIEVVENADANDLKEKIRSAVEKAKSPAELFFYYTGHGYSYQDEFFYCATNFDNNRPNETGLSTTDLHTLFRLASADLVIKVADACNSGTHLVKADVGLTPQNKQGFKNFIQISSCLDSQSSLTGDPLSLFTHKFRNAALSKTEGIVYYTDVIAALRDQFIGNDAQIPFFVSQYTGREQFTDDAHKLNKLRDALRRRETATAIAITETEPSPAKPPTLAELLNFAEAKLATSELMSAFVGTFFDNLKDQLAKIDVAEFFQIDFAEHDDFLESTTKRFIIDTLSREKRPDNFVKAEISRKRRGNNPFDASVITMALASWYDDEQYLKMYDLELNCKMPRAQLRVTFTPKFSALNRLVLVVTCAPSLETCYLFELVTKHRLHDFGKFDVDGTKAVERWYKLSWRDSTTSLVSKISDTLSTIIRGHIEDTAKRFTS